LGIILLCLLALALVILLLALFWPVSYRGGGSAQAGNYRAWFRFRWLFGLARGTYAYPESGSLQVRVLWLTVYDSGRKREKVFPKDETEAEKRVPSGKPLAEDETRAEKRAQSGQTPAEDERQTQSGQTAVRTGKPVPSKRNIALTEGQTQPEQTAADMGQSLSEKQPGFQEKLQFYLELARNEDNWGLVRHVLDRLGRIIKSLRPRYLWAEALVGLREPDLTGYVYGIYWAVKPFLGKKCHVAVTPDFERQVLEGEVTLGGRIRAAVVLYHAVRVLLDRRLRQLLEQLKRQV